VYHIEHKAWVTFTAVKGFSLSPTGGIFKIEYMI
jgi:hypothetical protein